ncbi:MAG: hypothetical protein NTZ09_06915, partial [Candidatus Hydrogenedentes bacterium]|nr:hypothetical protein [Candidatus Hydrogenedentota bacterium]
LALGWIGWPVQVGDSFFFGYEADSGNQLWVSDWTPAGTHAVPGMPPNTQDLEEMIAFKNNLYFGNEGTGQIWVSQRETAEVEVCDPGHVLVSELDGLESFMSIYWPDFDTILDGLGMTDYRHYDLENVHLIIGGVSPAPPAGPAPGDGWYDWFELRLVEHVLCNDRFWAHDLVTDLFNQNKELFQQDIADLYAASCTPGDPDGDPLLILCGEQFGNLVPAAALLSSDMRDTIDGLLALGFGDTTAPFSILPQISSYATCCSGAKVTGELFSPDGDLDLDGISNQDEFDAAMAATGDLEIALMAITDEYNFWPGNPDMPATGIFGLAALAASLFASGFVFARKK